MKKFRDGLAEETHAYHAIREKLRHQLHHPRRALDLKAKYLIGHLWVSLIIDQSECLVWGLWKIYSCLFIPKCMKICEMVKQTKRTRITQSGKNCAINWATQGARLIWKQNIWLVLTKPCCLVANQKRELISYFCTELTLFCTVFLKKNCAAFSQSEWRNFLMYIINILMQPTSK